MERPPKYGILPSRRKRRMSCPPITFADLSEMRGKHFYSRNYEKEGLYLSPKDAQRFASFECILETSSKRILFTDDRVLKTYSYLVDVSQIVEKMNLAGLVVPVPQVYEYGYSGNSSYILMERVAGYPLSNMIEYFDCPIPEQVTNQLRDMVKRIASVGLCHNDLFPRNVVMSLDWNINAIIDWDECVPLLSEESMQGEP
ncbi:hypothetical protein VNI00_016112 [Paramarasmius palmivorus]|uniref:Aminoglycoside phosphotransferase domain-containing protein n=1 Tax=Paramarasmius palmivorus TaxID=297713 RepID=A0AAW0BGS4_9AGAR